MAGALMQLVAYGAQDVYLTGDPQITFFKVVYRRHTNFAIESIEQSLIGNPDFGQSVTCKISRSGDLLGATYLQATVSGVAGQAETYVPRLGFHLLNSVTFKIGGVEIDKQTGTWMDVWTELTSSYDKKANLDKLVGARKQAASTPGVVSGPENHSGDALNSRRLHVPLQFSFCRNPGLALPLIALQYHEVELVIKFETKAGVSAAGTTNTAGLSDVVIFSDYFFLDGDERKKFAQESHEYLIETVQEYVGSAATNETTLNQLSFNHPVKELVWVYTNSDGSGKGDYRVNDAADANLVNPLSQAVLRLNGKDRFDDRTVEYFAQDQVYQYHTGNPVTGINVYSFALNPEEHQPSGTCNFSRIDNAELSLSTITYGTQTRNQINIFAHGYNVLRVSSGMGGLAYSN